MDKKLRYSELEAENAELKVENADTRMALANALLLFDTVNELYQG